jgi:hypothetical protein
MSTTDITFKLGDMIFCFYQSNQLDQVSLCTDLFDLQWRGFAKVTDVILDDPTLGTLVCSTFISNKCRKCVQLTPKWLVPTGTDLETFFFLVTDILSKYQRTRSRDVLFSMMSDPQEGLKQLPYRDWELIKSNIHTVLK